MNKFAFALAAGVGCLALVPTAAQQPPADSAMGGGRAGTSYQLSADRKLTFEVNAKNASDVAVMFGEPQIAKRIPLTKGEDGRWTATIGPVDPDLYDYSFVIDGVRANADILTVPGTPPLPSEVADVQHGSVNMHSYFSKVQNRLRGVHVYVPPQYYSEPNRKFPVVYLWAGRFETEWVRTGHANVILDNLIAQHKAVPMIVVMPNNTVGPRAVPAMQNAEIIGREFTAELMPWVESHYRTVNDRDHRATAGLSFGGGSAFIVGMRNLDKVGYITEYSTGVFGSPPVGGAGTSYAPYDPEQITPAMYAQLKAPKTRLKLLYMSVGTEDGRRPFQEKAYADFKAAGIAPVFKTFPGAHEWKVFRASFADAVPMLFK